MKETFANKLILIAFLLLGGAIVLAGVSYFLSGKARTPGSEKSKAKVEAAQQMNTDEIKSEDEEKQHKISKVESDHLPNAIAPKLESLQIEVKKLQHANEKIQTENQKLNWQLKQLKDEKKSPGNKKKPSVTSPNYAALFQLQSLKLASYFTENQVDYPTHDHALAEKLSGLIGCSNMDPEAEFTELILVVNRPNGLVLNTGWESGTFNTGKGERPYTKKIRFDSKPGEFKSVHFDIKANRFEKGIYTVKLYQGGKLLAKLSHELN